MKLRVCCKKCGSWVRWLVDPNGNFHCEMCKTYMDERETIDAEEDFNAGRDEFFNLRIDCKPAPEKVRLAA